MKKIAGIFIILLCVFILLMHYNNTFSASNPINQESPSNDINFYDVSERYEELQISDEVLTTMSTIALVESVENYPLSISLYHFDTIELGYQTLKENFNGLAELEKRMLENPEEVENLLKNRIQVLKEEKITHNLLGDYENPDYKWHFLSDILNCLKSVVQ